MSWHWQIDRLSCKTYFCYSYCTVIWLLHFWKKHQPLLHLRMAALQIAWDDERKHCQQWEVNIHLLQLFLSRNIFFIGQCLESYRFWMNEACSLSGLCYSFKRTWTDMKCIELLRKLSRCHLFHYPTFTANLWWTLFLPTKRFGRILGKCVLLFFFFQALHSHTIPARIPWSMGIGVVPASGLFDPTIFVGIPWIRKTSGDHGGEIPGRRRPAGFPVGECPRWISRMVWWLWGAFPWVFTTPRATWPAETWRLDTLVSRQNGRRSPWGFCIIRLAEKHWLHLNWNWWWNLHSQRFSLLPAHNLVMRIDWSNMPSVSIHLWWISRCLFRNHELWHPWTQINPGGLPGSGPCPGSSHRVRKEAASRDCGRVMQGAPWNSPNLKFPCLPAVRVRPVLEIHAPLFLGDQLGRLKTL